MKKRRIIVSAVALVLAVLIGKGVLVAARSFSTGEKQIPTVRVERGEVEIDVFTSGELRAPNSASLVAPPVNGTLQIVSMLPTGAPVKAGETVVQFDPSEQEYNFEQSESQLQQAEQDIAKAKADAAVQAAQDQTALLKARFDVRRAELEVGRNELVSTIDAQKNNLALDEAKRALAQLEQDVKSRVVSGEAGISVLVEKRNSAQLAMKVAKQNIDNMTLKSTLNGIVAAKENRDATGGFFFSGMILPEYRAGDLVQSGRVLAEVLDVSQMEVQAKVGETDRANIAPNERAEVQIDAHPGEVLSAKVKSVAGLASRDFWSGNSQAKFPASFRLEQNSTDLRPGISALVKVHGARLSGVLFLPSQSLFDKDGKQVVYVKRGSDFEAVTVKVKYRTESRIVIEGVNEGTEVAVVDPTVKEKFGAKANSVLAGAL
jgi:multidrug resistance efflux pump